MTATAQEPLRIAPGEESHVLLKGQKVLYALGDKLFVKEGPYIVNIPPMVPHSFQNLDREVAELVVIFPTNVWEYDVLDFYRRHKEFKPQGIAELNEGGLALARALAQEVADASDALTQGADDHA